MAQAIKLKGIKKVRLIVGRWWQAADRFANRHPAARPVEVLLCLVALAVYGVPLELWFVRKDV